MDGPRAHNWKYVTFIVEKTQAYQRPTHARKLTSLPAGGQETGDKITRCGSVDVQILQQGVRATGKGANMEE